MPKQSATRGVDGGDDLMQLLGAVAEPGQHWGDERAGTNPAAASRAIASTRRRGFGVPGSVRRQTALVECAEREVDRARR